MIFFGFSIISRIIETCNLLLFLAHTQCVFGLEPIFCIEFFFFAFLISGIFSFFSDIVVSANETNFVLILNTPYTNNRKCAAAMWFCEAREKKFFSVIHTCTHTQVGRVGNDNSNRRRRWGDFVVIS